MAELWKQSCTLDHIKLRAQLLKQIRSFFECRDVLEVETPLLCQATGTDPQLDFFTSRYHYPPDDQVRYLQTSPEFAMKRLLAAGSGSIYQICKAFRNGEQGRLHNPEFSILEWYRLDFNIHQLMDEVVELLTQVLNDYCTLESIDRISYQALFEQCTGLNPLQFSRQQYQQYAIEHNMADAVELCQDDHAMWLDLIFSYQVQTSLMENSLTLVYGYPAVQASLARINADNPAIADRFEVFLGNLEIGNGFFELADANEQENRFDAENKIRAKNSRPQVVKDTFFLDALESGLPDCSGIALGLDRLLMYMSREESLTGVLAFPFDRA